jgi:hypothetical protein
MLRPTHRGFGAHTAQRAFHRRLSVVFHQCLLGLLLWAVYGSIYGGRSALLIILPHSDGSNEECCLRGGLPLDVMGRMLSIMQCKHGELRPRRPHN